MLLALARKKSCAGVHSVLRPDAGIDFALRKLQSHDSENPLVHLRGSISGEAVNASVRLGRSLNLNMNQLEDGPK
jgi:hypothetical protein